MFGGSEYMRSIFNKLNKFCSGWGCLLAEKDEGPPESIYERCG